MSNYKPPYREWRASNDPEAMENLKLLIEKMKTEKEREAAKATVRGVMWCFAFVSLIMCFFIVLNGLLRL
jgi:hypothetical protein